MWYDKGVTHKGFLMRHFVYMEQQTVTQTYGTESIVYRPACMDYNNTLSGRNWGKNRPFCTYLYPSVSSSEINFPIVKQKVYLVFQFHVC